MEMQRSERNQQSDEIEDDDDRAPSEAVRERRNHEAEEGG
jgi:hypothetical protein